MSSFPAPASLRCFSSSSRGPRAFSRLRPPLSTWRARRFAANISSFVRAAVSWAIACSFSESSLGGDAFLDTFFAGVAVWPHSLRRGGGLVAFFLVGCGDATLATSFSAGAGAGKDKCGAAAE
jgi:hypothetical protein